MPTTPTPNSLSSGATAPGQVLISAFFPFDINLEGVGTLVFGMARGLLAAGWRVRLLLPAGTRVPAGCEGVDAVHTYSGGVTGWLAYLRALRRHAQPGETVLWVENNPNMALLGSLALGAGRGCWYFYTPLQPASLVATLGWRLQAVAHALTKNALWSRLQNWRQRRCMVATQHQARQVERFHPAAVQVHPGVPLPVDWCRVSRDEARRRLGWDDRPVAGYLGHFAPAKGVPLLLRAFARLLAEDATSNSVLALAHSGRGRLAAADDARLEALRGAGRLREVGVTDPALFLAACDCVILPYPSGSIHHPPLVLIEAYAAATAVVTTDVGGIAELVVPGETGALVPPGDEDALAAAIRCLLADLPACHAQGRRGHALFQTRLSQTPFCAAVAEFLRQEERR
jgi:glycosyltransferase involved in cell wall biosynthesis